MFPQTLDLLVCVCFRDAFKTSGRPFNQNAHTASHPIEIHNDDLHYETLLLSGTDHLGISMSGQMKCPSGKWRNGYGNVTYCICFGMNVSNIIVS